MGMTRKTLKYCIFTKKAEYPTVFFGTLPSKSREMLLNPDIAEDDFPNVYFFIPATTDRNHE